MKLGIVVASEGASANAFAVFRGIKSSAPIIHSLGYDGMELALKNPNEITRDELKSILKTNSLEVSAISTGQVFATRGLMFTEEDRERREALFDAFRGFIDLASDFGGLVNVGRVRGTIGDRDKAHCEELFMNLMNRVLDYAEPRGVTILLEPVNRYEIDYINSVDEGGDLVRKVGRKNFRLMPDVFHMNIEDAHFGDAFRRNADVVGYVHLADSNRHGCGDGHLDFEEVFSALHEIGYNSWCTVECFPVPDALTAAARSIDYLRGRFI